MGECRVLGAIRAFDADGRELTLVSEPQRRLLAILCCHAGGVVRSAALEQSLGLSAGALRTSISRLRRVLGPEALRPGPAGYELTANVDVVEYERLVGEADRRARCGEMEATMFRVAREPDRTGPLVIGA